MSIKKIWKALADRYPTVDRSLTVNIDGMNAIVVIDGEGVHYPANRGRVDSSVHRYRAALNMGASRMTREV